MKKINTLFVITIYMLSCNGGPNVQYYKNGNKMCESNMKNGVLDGVTIDYDTLGKVHCRRYYTMGNEDSVVGYLKDRRVSMSMVKELQNDSSKYIGIRFYENGMIKSREETVHTQKNGMGDVVYSLMTLWDSTGSMTEKSVWKKDSTTYLFKRDQ
ncbi:MAG: hypothetical protein HY064_14635 [Bacteroidetes bacterium]|nr:hypothetical protein [Bacteroidota bacterium]